MDVDSEHGASHRHPVLVVEDDPDIRECVQMVLEEEGYEVITAANGEEAERELDHIACPCLMLLDLMMPVMSGWELLEHLRHSGRLDHDLQVVVVSASPTHLPRGPIRCMRKPVRLDQLLATVKELQPAQ
jgi:CheY-like chemotaxis protein